MITHFDINCHRCHPSFCSLQGTRDRSTISTLDTEFSQNMSYLVFRKYRICSVKETIVLILLSDVSLLTFNVQGFRVPSQKDLFIEH